MGLLRWLAAAAVGVAVAILLPSYLEPLVSAAELIAIVAGVAVFALGGVVAEMIGRQAADFDVIQQSSTLSDAVRALREEVRKVREVQHGQLDAVPEKTANIEALSGDVRVLKTVVSQLATRQAATERAAAAKAGERAVAAAKRGGDLTASRDEPGFDPGSPDAMADADDEPPLDDRGHLLAMAREAIHADRVDLYLQPILSLPQRKLQYYEFLPRLRDEDGGVIDPARVLERDQTNGLAAALDNQMLVRAVQYARRTRRRAQPISYFINIAGESLRDREFLNDFIAFMRDNTDLAGVLGFEITQHDAYRLDARTDAELTRLAGLGFRFCMDETTNLDLFVSDLSTKGYRFVKVDAAVLTSTLSRDGDPRALKRALDRGAIDLIVTGIETDATVLDLLDYAVDFGQGRVFGEPRPADPR